MPKERPILFTGDMVRAILDGRKTQTRREIKPQPVNHPHVGMVNAAYCSHPEKWLIDGDVWRQSKSGGQQEWFCPFGIVGDRLWVKETFSIRGLLWNMKPAEAAKYASNHAWIYRADIESGVEPSGLNWKPSIFMPRKASRLTLEITGVRVERLQEISHKDVLAEGVNMSPPLDADIPPDCINLFSWRYQKLWEHINGSGSWAKNPWVWVIEFKRQ